MKRILILVLILLFIFSINLYAQNEDEEELTALQRAAYNFANFQYKNGVGGLIKLVKLNPDDNSSIVGKLVEFFNGAFNYIKPFGYLFSLIFFFITLFEESTSGNVTINIFIKCFSRFILSILVIEYSKDIVVFFMRISDSLFDYINNSTIDDKNSPISVSAFSSLGAFECLSSILTNLIPFLVSFISSLLTIVLVVQRNIKMVIYMLFAPIGMADIYHGANSSGIRYAKKTFSICFCGAVSYLILYSVFMLEESLAFTSPIATFGNLIYSVLAVMLLLGSEKLTSEMLGV